ncbi:MAG: DDE-type integrase/transposase/recombinase [Steroidobacteraceae bacterium]
MSTTAIEHGLGSRPRRPRADAGIVFGSAANAPAKKPDSVRATCEAIGLARSTYYYQSHRSAAAIEFEQKIVLRLHELRDEHPNDGYRRMTLQLQAEGFHVNRKRIARLMQLHSLTKRQPKPDTWAPRSAQPEAPIANLRESARLTGPYQVWVTDVAYGHIRSGLVYAAAVIDAWSREVVGYAASLQITNRLARIALHSAVRAHRPAPGCIHHSTCGTQYLTRSYCELLRQYGLIPSVSEAMQRGSFPSHDCPEAARHIVDVQNYQTWRDVLTHPREFIQALYSPERIEALLGRQTVDEPAPAAMS